MRRKFIKLLLVKFLILNFCPSGQAFHEAKFACECAHRNDFQQEFELSQTVFVGEVAEVSNSRPDSRISFKVERLWKGKKIRKLVLSTDNQGKACGYVFKKGERYLVYAYDKDGDLRTDICTRTAEIGSAAADLEELARKKRL